MNQLTANKEIKQYKSTGEIGSGEGMRAGVAYKMADGSFIYVPEEGEQETSAGGQQCRGRYC